MPLIYLVFKKVFESDGGVPILCPNLEERGKSCGAAVQALILLIGFVPCNRSPAPPLHDEPFPFFLSYLTLIRPYEI